ncbi:MAG TPA: MarR family winged helix-turn-helix transcriptional regulator [Streptosporangiaceae bacterium]|nr:MarR family winged helix-turn-helix transcriptional regulator [Streptosporangiaceae bacterium]
MSEAAARVGFSGNVEAAGRTGPFLGLEYDGPAESAADQAWQLAAGLFAVQQARWTQAADQAGLTLSQLRTLLQLDPGNPTPMSQLARRLCLDASYITNLTDRLEARGYVTRGTAAHDRRVKTIIVTRDGAALRAKIAELLFTAPAEIASLPEPDQQTLVRILRRALQPGA